MRNSKRIRFSGRALLLRPLGWLYRTGSDIGSRAQILNKSSEIKLAENILVLVQYLFNENNSNALSRVCCEIIIEFADENTRW